MKILQVNKFYYPKDGVSNYLLGLESKLKELGHEVRIFAMDSPKNVACPDQKYFVSYLSFDKGGLMNTFRSLGRIFYSFESKRKFQALINDFHPDIIHIHNIYHQISPSILSVARREKIPVVMHLHDYKLICPNYKLFTHGETCERCRGSRYYNCTLNKCVKNSYFKSLAATLEMYFHHNIWHIYEKGIKLFIAPSYFMKETVERFGWPKEKIITVHNFFNDQISNPANKIQSELGDYLLYFGRLSEEKGTSVLIEAIANTNQKLKIAGEGPDELKLRNLVLKLKLEDRISFLGFKTGVELEELINNAKAIVIPSVWYENMPLNMLESMARRKIVIASRIGGMPEIIKDGENGLLFTPGNANELAKKISELDSLNYELITASATATVKNLNAAEHVEKILKIYNDILK